MSNVLDLKAVRPGATDARLSADVPVVPAAQEPPIVETPEADVEASDIPEELQSAQEDDAVSPTTDEDLPAAVSWVAHHPLVGEARRRHFIFSVALLALGAIISFWQRGLSAFIVIGLGVIALELRQHLSAPVSVSVDPGGVVVDGERYDHASFASFHIHRMPDDTLELSLKSDRRLLPHLRLPLGEQDPAELFAVLVQYIPEGQHKIPLFDYYVRKPRT